MSATRDSAVAIGIANPLSAKFDTLRPSLLPGLVDAVAHNRRHGRRDVALFEIGTRFTAAGETRGVALAWTGGAAGDHWSGGAREVDFFDVKGVVEHLCDALGVPSRFEPIARAVPRRRASAAAIVVADGPTRGARLGVVGSSRRRSPTRAACRARIAVFVAEADLDRLAARARGRERRHRVRCRAIRSSSAISRSSSPTPCLRKSFVAPFRRPDATLPAPLTARQLLRSLSGQGRPDGRGEPLGAADVPGGRSHADRRRGAAERRDDSGGARPRTRRRSTIERIGHHGQDSDPQRGSRTDRSSRGEGEASRRHGRAHEGRDRRAPPKRTSGCRASSTRCAPGSRRAKGVATELSTLKEERDVIRTRVTDMLEQLEALNL